MLDDSSAFTIKDHKSIFPGITQCRLLNPSKSHLGIVSKNILDTIHNSIRDNANVIQWIKSKYVINWFKNDQTKHSELFIKFDTADFYPSITELIVDNAIKLAQKFTSISANEISIIKHSCKSTSYNNGTIWSKKNNNTLFDITMSSFHDPSLNIVVNLFYIIFEISRLRKIMTHYSIKLWVISTINHQTEL